MNRRDEPMEFVAVSGMITKTTDKAIRLNTGGDDDVWLPLSQCRGLPEVIVVKKYIEFEVAMWIAKTKGLI